MLALDENSSFDFSLLCLAIWRESRGELLTTKQAVAWTIKNRTMRPGWWGGPSYSSIILFPYQFSSFNHNDPNAVKWPTRGDPSWLDSVTAAAGVYGGTLPDMTKGATSYFDMSLDSDPPRWSFDGSQVHTVDFGKLHFYRTA